LQWAKTCLDMPRKTLSDVYEYTFRRPLLRAHQAKADVLALREILETGNIPWRLRMHPVLPCVKRIKGIPFIKATMPDTKETASTTTQRAAQRSTQCTKCGITQSTYFDTHDCKPVTFQIVGKLIEDASSAMDCPMTVEEL
jgi:hypothetical protein